MSGDALPPIIGTAMTAFLTELLGPHRGKDDKPMGATLAERAFAQSTGIVVDLDRLPTIVQDACSEANLPPTGWAREVGRKFTAAASAVFKRPQELTPQWASSLRITAVCLAVEAREHGLGVTADLFLHCAAGIILLERRAAGTAPITEAILLATT